MTKPIDQHLGEQLKKARKGRGLSQSDIANILDISYQQVQKYERGTNRISAARLFQLADILKIPIMYFYDGIPAADAMNERDADDADQAALIQYYLALPNQEQRDLFRNFVRAVANIGL